MFLHKSFSPKSFSQQSFGSFEIVIPSRPDQVIGGGGGGSKPHGYKLPSSIDHEERIRAEIIREDEEILAVLVGAVASGALEWLH